MTSLSLRDDRLSNYTRYVHKLREGDRLEEGGTEMNPALWLTIAISAVCPSQIPQPKRVSDAAKAQRPAEATPERRALDFLSREVPQWSPRNKCFSCHNNGDGARALYSAIRLSYPLAQKVLADTTEWLTHPERWDRNGGEEEFSNKTLADIQFAATLLQAVEAGLVKQKPPLIQSAKRVAAHQDDNGSWEISKAGAIGSPATYGRMLATVTARRVLVAAGKEHFRKTVSRSENWLGMQRPQTVLDSAALLMAPPTVILADQRKHCLNVISKGQVGTEGWGPYVTSTPEPFDTAVVLLALSQGNADKEIERMIRQGRAFLIETQLRDGSWLETTRPPDAESYAQRLSTAGWATRALLVTRRAVQRK